MSDLPESWATAPLRHLGRWQGGGTPSKAVPEFWQGSIPWVSPKDMKASVVRDSLDHISEAATQRSAATLIPERSILVVTRSGILAHSLPVAINAIEVTVNQDLKALTPSAGLSSDYLAYALKASERTILNDCVKDGTTVHSVEVPSLLDFEIPIAPAREQHRIVAKIEELFSELDKAVESLTLARAQLKTYRQALLKAAFEGRLTANWRAANPDKLEPSETLLARIRAEREARQEQALDDWRKAVAKWQAKGEVGRKPTKPRPFNVDLSAVADGVGSMEKLPFGWVWLRLHELCDESPKNGVYKPASEYGEGTQIVRIDDFYDGRLVRRSGFKKVTLTNEEEADYAVVANDLIVNRVNSIEYLGKCALIPTLDAATVFESNIMRLRPADAAVRTDWLTRYLSSSAGQDRMRENAKHAVNQASINQNDVGLVLVPYCATEEQGEIVAVLDETLSAVETTDREIGDALRRVSALRQSILKQAFSGHLVPQEPTDEPAAALLARLREEAPTARPRRRRTA